MFDQLTNVSPLTIVGGQKKVYFASHLDFGEVVYKEISPGRDHLERTKREILAARIIASPNVPQVYAHNAEDENPDPLWILEERIPGDTLRHLLNTGKEFSISEIVAFIDTILRVLILAEDKDIVHRDIKPENIMMDAHGVFYLLDFGIARHLTLESITNSNQDFGLFTLGYASSEQFSNLKRQIDIRADLFSLGVVAYELATGKNYYVENSNGTIMGVLQRLQGTAIPRARIPGDREFLLTAFISLIGDHRRNRRPRTAADAYSIFETVVETLNL